MEIQKYTPTESKLVSAMQGTKIKNINAEALSERTADLINKLFAIVGQRPDINDSFALSILFRNELLTYFQNVTIDEIELACEKGIRKEYGEYFGINIVTLHSWVKSHLNDTIRLNTAKKISQLQSAPKEMEYSENEISLISQRSIAKNKVIALAHEYSVMDWDLFDIGNACYNQLDAKGLIIFTPAEKLAFMDKAKSKLVSETNFKKVTLSISKNNFADFMKEIESKNSSSVVIRAKKIALFYHFRKDIA